MIDRLPVRPGRLAAALLLLATAPALAQPNTNQTSERIADGVVRVHRDAAARTDRLPSFALQAPRPSLGQGTAALDVAFSTTTDANNQTRYVAHLDIEPGTSLYGTGEVAGPLRRNGRVVETWNTDAYGYQDEAKSLYTSHPWVLGVREDGSAFGVLADTTERCEIDLTDGITFRARGRWYPVIVIDRDTPQGVMQALGELIGTITMPPKWAIGYHQCRYSYYPDARVREIARGFREHNIPADVIWMDIDYMNAFQVFTFNDEHFPDPKALNSWLHEQGWKNVWMIDPGVANVDGYFVHDSGTENDVWVKTADGSEYNGDVWPGECVFPDYLNADVRTWWAGLYDDFMAHGIDGVWNDMNEPAVFNVESKTMPEDNVHRADPELGGVGPHARYHNVYGMMMVKASREGIMAANPDKRPFVLSRANFIGGHRYAATWTGDNTANWYHVDVSIPMTLNLGLSGQPFAGPDIGGFVADGTPEMYARWIGFGALMPFSRGHTGKGNRDKEPWAYGPEIEATARRALERRYRLLPYLYTLFDESSHNGMPVARPTFFADPADKALHSEDDSFLLGADLLVVANTVPDRSRMAVLPKPVDGVAWREFDFEGFDGERDSLDPDQPKLYVRPGAIIPTGPVIQYVGDTPNSSDELTLIIHLDANGTAEGTLYEDAGEGWDYKTGGYLRSMYRATEKDGVVTVRLFSSDGAYPRPEGRRVKVRLLRPGGNEIVAQGTEAEPIRIALGRHMSTAN